MSEPTPLDKLARKIALSVTCSQSGSEAEREVADHLRAAGFPWATPAPSPSDAALFGLTAEEQSRGVMALHKQLTAAEKRIKELEAPSPSREGWLTEAEIKWLEADSHPTLIRMALSALRPAVDMKRPDAINGSQTEWYVYAVHLEAAMEDALRPAGDEGVRVAAEEAESLLDSVETWEGSPVWEARRRLQAALHTEKKEGL